MRPQTALGLLVVLQPPKVTYRDQKIFVHCCSLPARIHILLLVRYLRAQIAEFPHLALVTLEVGVELNRSARGKATTVGQAYAQVAIEREDAVIQE